MSTQYRTLSCTCGARLRAHRTHQSVRCPKCMEVITVFHSAPRIENWFQAAGRITLLLFVGLLVLVSLYATNHPEGDKPTELLSATKTPHPENRTPTDREINRLCRQWTKVQVDPNNNLLSWQTGWDGPLGDIAARAGLTFNWRCHVASHSDANGISCQTRPNGPVRYRLHALHLNKVENRDDGPIQTGEILVLRGIRHALSEQNGVVINVKENCHLDVILAEDRHIIRTKTHHTEEHATR